jgi:hypothetical protein
MIHLLTSVPCAVLARKRLKHQPPPSGDPRVETKEGQRVVLISLHSDNRRRVNYPLTNSLSRMFSFIYIHQNIYLCKEMRKDEFSGTVT